MKSMKLEQKPPSTLRQGEKATTRLQPFTWHAAFNFLPPTGKRHVPALLRGFLGNGIPGKLVESAQANLQCGFKNHPTALPIGERHVPASFREPFGCGIPRKLVESAMQSMKLKEKLPSTARQEGEATTRVPDPSHRTRFPISSPQPKNAASRRWLMDSSETESQPNSSNLRGPTCDAASTGPFDHKGPRPFTSHAVSNSLSPTENPPSQHCFVDSSETESRANWSNLRRPTCDAAPNSRNTRKISF